MTTDLLVRVDTAIERLLAEHPPAASSDAELWAAQFDLGLAWVHFPTGRGGLGADPALQAVVNQRLRAAGASLNNWERNIVGLGMSAPTVAAHAADELQDRLLRPMFTCEEIWCQLFSEPGAGSDLAGVATAAVRDGDDWVVNGQKVWTTLAHEASWGLLLTRTDPDVPKHAGLTYFLVDMRSAGIEVRPLFELTGEAEFNEVFLTDVRIPDLHRLGPVGAGWKVAMTTLMNERVAVGDDAGHADRTLVEPALRTWRTHATQDPGRRDRLMRLWVRAEVLRLSGLRNAEMAARGAPGPEGSIAKLQWAELHQDVAELALDQLGPEGMLYPDGYRFERPEASSVHAESPWKAFLRSRANTIEGGTSEVMRNVIAERTLGLPPEPRPDRHLPWRDVPRSARPTQGGS